MGTRGLSGLAAGLAMAAAAAGLAGLAPVRRAEEPSVDMAPEPKRKRGPMPKRSREMSDDYRLSVRAQRGFSANRIQALRAQWVKLGVEARRGGPKQPEWWAFLEANRKSALEVQFTGKLHAA